MWSRAKSRRCKPDIPTGLHGKHLHAVSTRKGAVGVKSPVDKRNIVAEWRHPAVQFEEQSEDVTPDGDCKMEVDGEADSRKLRMGMLQTRSQRPAQNQGVQAYG